MTELFAVEDGSPDGAPLVLGNSLGTTVAVWDPLVPALAERHRLIRYDHRGHGQSPAPPGPYEIADLAADVIELLDRLEIATASYCGVSIGGMVGIWLAAHNPDRIERLVVCCSSAHMGPPSRWRERADAVREAGTVDVVADAIVERWLTPEFAAEHPGTHDGLRTMLASSPPDGYAECCGAIERMDLRPLLPGIAVPTLVIAGARDLAAPPPEHGQLIADGIPGARYELVDAAHLASVEQPQRVSQLILDHVDAEATG